jgi:hypothetical protein
MKGTKGIVEQREFANLTTLFRSMDRKHGCERMGSCLLSDVWHTGSLLPAARRRVFRGEVGNCGTHALVSLVCCGSVDRCPADSVPASLGQRRKDGRQRVSFRSRKAPPQQNDADVARQASYIWTILKHANLSNETAAAVAATVESEHPLHCGSDGGLLNGIGTFGFVWANASSREVLASGKGYVPGHIVGMSSTRAELCGIFAALIYLELATKYHHLVLP